MRIGSTSSTSANATFERCVFSNNTVTGEGLIRVYPKGKLTLKDCDFTEKNTIPGCSICKASIPTDVTDGGGNNLAKDQKLK